MKKVILGLTYLCMCLMMISLSPVMADSEDDYNFALAYKAGAVNDANAAQAAWKYSVEEVKWGYETVSDATLKRYKDLDAANKLTKEDKEAFDVLIEDAVMKVWFPAKDAHDAGGWLVYYGNVAWNAGIDAMDAKNYLLAQDYFLEASDYYQQAVIVYPGESYVTAYTNYFKQMNAILDKIKVGSGGDGD